MWGWGPGGARGAAGLGSQVPQHTLPQHDPKGGGGGKFFDTGSDFFSRVTPPRGGGGYKKSGSYRKNVFFPCRTYHTESRCSHHITCLWHSLAFLCLAIRGTSPCPTCHLQHVAVGGPFSMTCFAAQWHKLANNMHCRHGWYLCLRAQRPPSTPGYASCHSAPPWPLVSGKSSHAQCMGREPGQATGGPHVGTVARHGRSVGAPSLECTTTWSSGPGISVMAASVTSLLSILDPNNNSDPRLGFERGLGLGLGLGIG